MLMGVMVSAQTAITLTFNDDNSQEFSVTPSGKIYFSDTYLYIDDGYGIPYSFEISNIRKITLPHDVSIEDILTEDFTIYPNPAHNVLHIHNNRQELNTYQLYAMDGRLILKGTCHNDEPIAIGNLTGGLYLLKVNNTTFKISIL